uniref:t-SNARE coiled-coil homology domain-containing protein n=1 Tax=Setaria digitata TaxID=48799 RepID=A0A915Q6C4_9BILA
MGTLSVQPPTGSVRNLTEVFILLRNNALHNKFIFANNTTSMIDEKMSLVALDEETETVHVSNSSRVPPEWVNYLDEAQYELTRIRSRLKQIREIQQNHISKPSFMEDLESQKEMDKSTEEVTEMFTHCQRLISFIEKAYVTENTQQSVLRGNVISTLRLTLSNLAVDFRTNQAKFLKQIEARKETVNSYLLASTDWVNTEVLDDAPVDISRDGKFAFQQLVITIFIKFERSLTMEQIQLLLQNADMVKERERDVMSVSKSIVELNSLFKDLASMVIDQGTILDQIDYNLEQTMLRVKSALSSVQRAERYFPKFLAAFICNLLHRCPSLMSFQIVQIGASLYLECTHHLRCSEADRIRWFEMREHVQNLIELGSIAREDGYIIESTKLRHSLQYRDYLCAEHRSSGYLLHNSSNYHLQVACMWVGGEMNATCGLVPPTEKPFGYHDPQQWRRMLFEIAEWNEILDNVVSRLP